MKAYLIRISDGKAPSPGCRDWPDGDVIPAVICRPGVMTSFGAAMGNEAPEVVSIDTAADKPYALQRCQVVSVDVKAYNGRQGPGNALR